MQSASSAPSSDPRSAEPAGSRENPVSAPSIPDHVLLRKIGQGSYGEVWLASTVTGLLRAAKIVFRRSFDHARPFEREFEGIKRYEPVSSVDRSQIAIFHVGRNEEEEYFYYTMELADDSVCGPVPRLPENDMPSGFHPERYSPRLLLQEIRRRGRLPVRECIAIGLSLTRALEVLHANGLVHRDVKPSNIIFVDGAPKLADVGLVTSQDATLSHVGTQGFQPPEGPGTPRSDLYSLGKVLYEASTGNHCREFPSPPSNLHEFNDRDDWVELNEIILKACAPNVHERFYSAAAMRRDLERLKNGASLRSRYAIRRRVKSTASFLAAVVVGSLALFGAFSVLKNSSVPRPPTNGMNQQFEPGVAANVGRLEVAKKFDFPGVWRWSGAKLGQRSGNSGAIIFMPKDDGLVLITRDGEPVGGEFRVDRRIKAVQVDFLFEPEPLFGHCAAVSWRADDILGISVINQNPSEIKRFTSPGAARHSQIGLEPLSAIRPQTICELAPGEKRVLLAAVDTGYALNPRGIRCFDYETGSLLWQRDTAPHITEIATADSDGDGLLEIIAGSNATDNGNLAADGTDDSHHYLYAFRHTGEPLWTVELGGEFRTSHPIPADLDGDGRTELLAWVDSAHELLLAAGKTESGPVLMFDPNGNEIARYDAGVRIMSCTTADLDGNGRLEVLATDRLGYLHWLDSGLKCRRKIELVPNRYNYVDLKIMSVADLDSDLRPEIVLTSSEVEFVWGISEGRPDEPVPVRSYHANSIHVLDHELRARATFVVNEQTSWLPELRAETGDFTGDGRPEILVLGREALVLEYRPNEQSQLAENNPR